MARALSALPLLMFFGCANPTRTTQPPRLDFGLDNGDMAILPLQYPDLAVVVDQGIPDQGTLDQATTVDQATPDQATMDQATVAHADQAVTHDLAAAAADLAPENCNDAGTTGHLFLAAVGAANALVTSRFDPSSGWSAYQTAAAPAVSDVAEAVFAARPMVVARQTDNTLAGAEADSCSQAFPSLTALGSSVTTALRPAVLDGTDVVFRGATAGDLNLYYMYRPSATWLGPVKQDQLTTASAFSLVRFESVVQALYSDGGKLSAGTVSSASGGGAAAQILSDTTSQPPVAVVDKSGVLHVVFVGTDTNLYWIWRSSGAGWDGAQQHQVCAGQSGCIIDTNLPISLALDSTGTPIVAWVGQSPHQVYTTRLLSTTGSPFWDTPLAASGSCGTKDCQTTVGPALATGVGGAAAELVFVSDLDGRARHARLSTTWAEPTSIAGTNLLNTPALISEP